MRDIVVSPNFNQGLTCFSPEPSPPLASSSASPVNRVVQRFSLFWHLGCSAARNSPACKGKSLRCLRKCRFSYIDTSPALPARPHLTAALRYSACRPHRTSCLHLGCQTHQTWRAAPCQLAACSAPPIQNSSPGTTVAIVGAWHAPGRRLEPNARAVRCGRAGCEGEGRLRCASK